MNDPLCGSEQTPEKGWAGLREHVSKTREHFLYASFSTHWSLVEGLKWLPTDKV